MAPFYPVLLVDLWETWECQNWLAISQLLQGYRTEMLGWKRFLVRWHNIETISITTTQLAWRITCREFQHAENIFSCLTLDAVVFLMLTW